MAEPVSVAEAKQHLRVVDNTSEDTLIGTYIAAARRWIEEYTGHILVQREVAVSFQEWGDYLTIWPRPLVTLDEITYTDAAGDEVAFEDFVFSAGQYPLRLYPGSTFPTLGDNGTITVTLTVGYEAGAVPEPFILAIKVLLTAMFTNRGGSWDDAERAVKYLLRDFRPQGMA